MTDQETIDKAAVRLSATQLHGRYLTKEQSLIAAQALAGAGLLARADRRTYRNPPPGMVPADYYTPAEALELLAERDAKIERAEAEAANLEADYDRRGERLWRLAVKAGHTPSESDNDASAEHSVASALAERDEIAGRLSELLCDLTDGRLSKTGYDVPTMVREVESTFEKHAERDRADVIAERDALAASIQRVRDVHIRCADHPTCCDDDDFCHECGHDFPCLTIRALDDPQEQP